MIMIWTKVITMIWLRPMTMVELRLILWFELSYDYVIISYDYDLN